jgi:hypothetical protein
MMTIETYTYAPDCPASTKYRVCIAEQEQFVYSTAVASFVAFGTDSPAPLEVILPPDTGEATIHPLHQAIAGQREGCTLRFTVPGPGNYLVQASGLNPLFIYANPLDLNLPEASGAVTRIPAGTIAEARNLTLTTGQTLCIEPGAVLRGSIRASRAANIIICGGGIIDGGCQDAHAGSHPARLVVIEGCQDVTIRDVVMIQPEVWMLVIGACQDVHIANLRQIGRVISSDGIDVVGSQNVLIENCCLRNNDDCVVIKSCPGDSPVGVDWRGDVENIHVRGCILWNAEAGNALEIGHELQAQHIRSIRFEDIDIICVHGHGAPFSIHNGDRATVEDVTFENIRVEHHFDKLIDFRVMKSRFNHDEVRGQVRDVYLRNISVVESIYNPGYTVSVIGGYDQEHIVDGVHFENFILGERKITCPDDLQLFTRHTSRITFS